MPRPWLKVESVLPEHPKTRALAKLWGCHRYTAAGFLIALWAYCLEYQDDGDTSELPDEVLDDLAAPCHATAIGTIASARAALQQVGFLDPDGQIHDWEEYTGALLDQRVKDRVRQARRRKLEGSGSVSKEDWAELLALVGHRCVYCGRVRTRLGMDHVHPLSRGGRHEIGNVLPACRRCNTKKGTRTLEDCGFVVVAEIAALIIDTRFGVSKVRPNGSKPVTKASSPRVEKSRVAESRPSVVAEGPQQQRLGYVVACTVACNGGLHANPAIGDHCNELVASSQTAPLDWFAAGIPIAVAEKAITAAALAYKPKPRNPQPRDLRYFDGAVRDAWEREQQRKRTPAAAAASTPYGGSAFREARIDD